VCQEVGNTMMKCLIILYLSLYVSEIIEDEIVGVCITYGRYEKPIKYFSRKDPQEDPHWRESDQYCR